MIWHLLSWRQLTRGQQYTLPTCSCWTLSLPWWKHWHCSYSLTLWLSAETVLYVYYLLVDRGHTCLPTSPPLRSTKYVRSFVQNCRLAVNIVHADTCEHKWNTWLVQQQNFAGLYECKLGDSQDRWLRHQRHCIIVADITNIVSRASFLGWVWFHKV